MADRYYIHNKPTIAYFPRVNETFERLNRDILSALRCILIDLKLESRDRIWVIDIIPTTRNKAPIERLGRNADGMIRTLYN